MTKFFRKKVIKIAFLLFIWKYLCNFAPNSCIFMDIQLTYHRRHTTTTQVGALSIGSEDPVRIQTMANTSTNDVAGSVAQAARCMEAGAELVRFTTQGLREVDSLAQIGGALRSSAYGEVPLVADVHFQSDVADAAAKVVAKVRITYTVSQ